MKKDLSFCSIDELCHVEYGTRVVKKRDAGTIYPVYGGGGASFFMDEFNREDQFIISRFGMSEKCTRFVEGKFFLNDSGLTLKPKDENILNQRYLDYQCMSLNDLFFSLGKGSAQKNLHVDSFKKVILACHPLPVQKQIVEKLDAAFADIDKAISATEKNIENAEALFQKAINESQGELVALDELVTIKTGKLNSNAAVENGQYPFFTCSRKIFSINEFAFDCEALLLAGNNASGDFNVKHYQGKFNAYQRTYVITINDSKKVLYKHLYFQLLNSLASFKKMSVGANTKFLKLGMIKTLKVPLPTLAEQQNHLSHIEIIQENKEKLKDIYLSKLRLFEALKSSILNQAFSGELTKDAA